MIKTLPVPYTCITNDESCVIQVSYTTSQTDSKLMIFCTLNQNSSPLPYWLNAKTFCLQSHRSKGRYNLLYNEEHYYASTDTNIFIDKAYAAIMKEEELPLVK